MNMRGTKRPRQRHLRALGFLALAGAPALLHGCGSTDGAPPLFASLDLPVTLTEFRIRVNDFAEAFVATIEDVAEEVIDESDDQMVRRNAMEWRLRTVNVFLNSLNQPEPAAALIDAWVFCLQLDQFVHPGGAGEALFGAQQDLVRRATSRVVTEVEQVVISLVQGDPADGRALVEAWAADNPLADPLLIRSSSIVALANALERRDNSMFAALGRLQTGVDDITAQFQRYISVMPRTVRWQTQLILHETLYDEGRVVGLLDSSPPTCCSSVRSSTSYPSARSSRRSCATRWQAWSH